MDVLDRGRDLPCVAGCTCDPRSDRAGRDPAACASRRPNRTRTRTCAGSRATRRARLMAGRKRRAPGTCHSSAVGDALGRRRRACRHRRCSRARCPPPLFRMPSPAVTPARASHRQCATRQGAKAPAADIPAAAAAAAAASAREKRRARRKRGAIARDYGDEYMDMDDVVDTGPPPAQRAARHRIHQRRWADGLFRYDYPRAPPRLPA